MTEEVKLKPAMRETLLALAELGRRRYHSVRAVMITRSRAKGVSWEKVKQRYSYHWDATSDRCFGLQAMELVEVSPARTNHFRVSPAGIHLAKRLLEEG